MSAISNSRYAEVHARSLRDPEGFWAEAAREIDWIEPAKKVFDPSMGLYGRWFAGGVVNTVSKRPTAEKIRELNIDAGSFGRRQVSGDFAGALDDEGKWSYRLVALKRDSDSLMPLAQSSPEMLLDGFA